MKTDRQSKRQAKPLNLLNKAAEFFAKVKGVALSPTEAQERLRKRRLAREYKRWFRFTSYQQTAKAGNGLRQRRRYGRNRMSAQQRDSHKRGTVRPFHIFGNAKSAKAHASDAA